MVYTIEMYANNTVSQTSYVRKGVTQTIPPDSWDLWVNDIKAGSGLASGSLADNASFDSYAFCHQSNVLVPGTVYIDELEYGNVLPATSLIPSLSSLPNFGTVNVGSVSASSLFVISASNLAGDILITAPGNIELSSDNTMFSSQVVLQQLNGELITQPDSIYVRYAPVVAGLMLDSIQIQSTGTAIQKIAVTGTGTTLFSGSSDIVSAPGFLYPQQIAHLNYQAQDITVTNSVEAAIFEIRDGGVLQTDTDTLGTRLTGITLVVEHSEVISSIALYDDTLELAETSPGVTTVFQGLSVVTPDGGRKKFSVRITFLPTVPDHTRIVLTIGKVVTDITGSIMSAVNAGGAGSSTTGDDNTVEVVADRIVFAQQPSVVTVGDTMAPFVVIRATDASGNTDVDFAQPVSIVSGGILRNTPLGVVANTGIAVFPLVVHQALATNILLYASSGSFATVASEPFQVLELSDTLVSFPESWSGAPASVAAIYQDTHISGSVTMTRGSGLVAASSSSRFNSGNWSTSPALNLASNTSYLSFTITAAPAYKLNLNGAVLSFVFNASPTGPTRFGVYSSVEGFTSTSQQVGSDLTIAANSVVFPAFGYDQLGSVEIRVYGWNALATLGTGGFSMMHLVGRNAAIRYVYDGTWHPGDPAGVITAVNDIVVLSGNAVVSTSSDCNNVTIETNALLTIQAGTILTINGSVSGFGKFKGSETSKLMVKGSGSFGVLYMDQTSAVTRSLGSLVLDRANAGILVLGDSLDLCDSLSLYNGIFNTQGKLRLKSTVWRTAVVPEIKGSGAVTGNMIIEQFVSGVARRWRFLASPFSNMTFEDLRQEIFITGAGTGTTAGLLNSNGFDATLSNQPSVYSYNETAPGNLNAGWVALTNSTPSLNNQLFVPGKGYRIFIRGDRSDIGRLTGANATQNEVVIDGKGTINAGNITIPVSYTVHNGPADDGWNLVANPYPSAFNWQAYMDNGTYSSFIDSTIYILDATSGSYKSYNSFSRGGTLTNGIIPKGASFWVKANAANPVLTFAEQFKTTEVPIALFKTLQQDFLRIKLEFDAVTNDVFMLTHNAAASVYKDPYDIRKMNGEVNVMSVGGDGLSLAYDVRPLSAINDTVSLYVSGGTYTYSFKVESVPANRFYYLRDRKLNTLTLLTVGLVYPYATAASDTSSFGYRFQLIITNVVSLPVLFSGFRITPATTSVLLEWWSEANDDYHRFEVERKTTAGGCWERLGTIDFREAIRQQRKFHFMDEDPDMSGDNYYRIKCINASHQVFYSTIQVASFYDRENDEVYVCPNPANDQVKIITSIPVKEVLVLDATGKQLLSVPGKELQLAPFRKGLYYVKISGMNGEVSVQKLEKN